MMGRVLAAAVGLCALIAWPARAECRLNQITELPVVMMGMSPTVTATVNGVAATFLIDSGADYSVMAPGSAARFGLPLFDIRVRNTGVGGTVRPKRATAKTFALANLSLTKVDFLVEAGPGGVDGVIGENVLGLADVEYDLAHGVVRLIRPVDCAGQNLGYWADGAAAELALEHTGSRSLSDWDLDRHVEARLKINGQEVLAIFDTGAAASILTRAAAERAGVTPASAGVETGGLTAGFGPRAIQTWIAPFDDFVLGTEAIRTTQLRFGAIQLPGADMLLGADFFLSHRVYVANSQSKIFLTYNGGPVFRRDTATAPVTGGTH